MIQHVEHVEPDLVNQNKVSCFVPFSLRCMVVGSMAAWGTCKARGSTAAVAFKRWAIEAGTSTHLRTSEDNDDHEEQQRDEDAARMTGAHSMLTEAALASCGSIVIPNNVSS